MVVVVPRNIESERGSVLGKKKRERGRIRVRLVERMQYLTPGEHLPRAREREREDTWTEHTRHQERTERRHPERTPLERRHLERIHLERTWRDQNTPGEDLERLRSSQIYDDKCSPCNPGSLDCPSSSHKCVCAQGKYTFFCEV